MASSGTYGNVANFDIAKVIDESFRRIGVSPEPLTPEHTVSARISLDLMFISWVNQGQKQFIIDKQIHNLVVNEASFVLPAGTIDIIDMVVNDGGVDIPMEQIGRKEYLYIPIKTVPGRPTAFFVDKSEYPPTVYLFPVTNISSQYLTYNRLRLIQDVGVPTNTLDTMLLWTEAICAGLAAKLAEKYAPNRWQEKDALATREFNFAQEADRSRGNLRILPRFGRNRYARAW